METTTPPQATETTETKTPIQKLSNRITDAILIAVASAGAYLCSFLYERGYTSYFGIPQEFINVSLINLLIFGAGIVSILWFVYAFYDVVFVFIRPKHPYLAHFVPWTLRVFLIMVLLPLVIYGWQGIWFFLIMVSLWALYGFYFLILPLIMHRQSGGWTERYSKQYEGWIKKETPVNLQSYLGNRLGNRNIGFLILYGFYATAVIHLAGGFQAEKQTRFLVTNTTPVMVVLRVYGDNMICAPFDKETKEVKKSFLVLKIAEDPKLLMNLENVGPLKPVDKLSSENQQTAPAPTP